MSEQLAEELAAPVDPGTTLWWAVPFAAILLLLMLAMLLGKPEDTTGRGTSYDASSSGYRAAYLLLEELGYPVTRSKRPTGGAARLVLSPAQPRKDDGQALEEWVREGGLLILADPSGEFGKALGMPLKVEELDPDPGEERASGLGIGRLAAGNERVTWTGHRGRDLVMAGDGPVVTVHELGRGQVWLLNRPQFLTNKLIRKADNAVLLCRLADEAARQGGGPLAFDEFVHGMRERPGVMVLLGQPPALWMTLQAVLLMAVLLWHSMPRFGLPLPSPPPGRRSKEEFLDAIATVLERKGDESDAFRTIRDNLANEIGRELGLPPDTPPVVVARETARRRNIEEVQILRLLTTASVPRGAFLSLVNELETIHDEFFDRRHHR